jgi:hypothetical protein
MAKKKPIPKEIKHKNIKVGGQNLTGEIYDVVLNSAKASKMTVSRFVKRYEADIIKLRDKTFIDYDVRTDELFTYISNSTKRKFTIDTGNGLVKYTKKQVLKKLADYVNYVKTNSDIDFVYPHSVIKYNGNVTIQIPEDYKHYKGKKLSEFLEGEDVDFFEYDSEIGTSNRVGSGTIKRKPKTIKKKRVSKAKRNKKNKPKKTRRR